MAAIKALAMIFLLHVLPLSKSEARKECIYPETFEVWLANGSLTCPCDISRGFYGKSEDSCNFKKCEHNERLNTEGTCVCADTHFLKNGVCMEKTRCAADEIVIYNGSHSEDRQCAQNITAPVVEVAHVTTSSIKLKVQSSDINAETVQVKYKPEGIEDEGFIEKDIESEQNVTEVEVDGLKMGTTYLIDVKIQSFAGLSDSRLLTVHTEPTWGQRNETGPLIGIICGVVGGIVMVGSIGFLVFIKWRRQRSRNQAVRIVHPESSDEGTTSPQFLPPDSNPLEEIEIVKEATAAPLLSEETRGKAIEV